MTAKIIDFPGMTILDLDPKKVLAAVPSEEIENLILIGMTKDGEFYYAGTTSHVPTMLWYLECFKKDCL